MPDESNPRTGDVVQLKDGRHGRVDSVTARGDVFVTSLTGTVTARGTYFGGPDWRRWYQPTDVAAVYRKVG